MFEPHNYTPQPPDTQAQCSAPIAAVEDGCQACAMLLDAFLEERASSINLDDIPDLSLGEDWHDDGRPRDHVEPDPISAEAFDAYSKYLDQLWNEPQRERKDAGEGVTIDDFCAFMEMHT